MIFLLAALTFVSTLIGGMITIRNQDKLPLFLGATAGIILGIISFELLPEIFELAHHTGTDIERAMIGLAGGFMVFHVAQKLLLVRITSEDTYNSHRHPVAGSVSAGALIAHSFLDGLAIGLAFQTDTRLGLAVAFAVIAHDFADGINTVSIMLSHKSSKKTAAIFLLFDALAPLLGVLAGSFLAIPPDWLLVYLGAFVGILFYISANDILPEAHRNRSSVPILALTTAGIVFIYITSQFSGH